MQQTKIDWADFTWNPVTGCKNTCPYCYARSMARRFAGPWAAKENKFWTSLGGCGDPRLKERIREFQPTWLESNWIRFRSWPKKPCQIFVNSMSDIVFWKRKWMHEVLDVIYERPQHTFMFLTKAPVVYSQYHFPKNCWLGATATTKREVIDRTQALYRHKFSNIVFLSIEPIMERIQRSAINTNALDWIIVGAETGNRKERIVPLREWIEDIVFGAPDTPIFLKNNIAEIWNRKDIKEFPEAIA
jgi:protein gp37